MFAVLFAVLFARLGCGDSSVMGRTIVALVFQIVTLLAFTAHAQSAPENTPGQTAGPPAAPAPVAAAVPAAQPPQPQPSLPFRLGLFFAKAFGQSGDLAQGPTPAAVGLDIALGLGHSVRYHLGIANEWESRGSYSAKGFRLDLVSLGFPIQVMSDRVVVHIEPIARIIRGEILFPAGMESGALFRVESGFAVAITAAMAHWFVAVEPLSIDFRTFTAFTAGPGGTQTGYSHLWWFQITAGREF